MAKALIKKNLNIIALSEQFVRLAAVTDDGYYRYKIKYLVDPVKAVKNNLLSVHIHVATVPFVRERQKTFTNTNSTDVIRQLKLRNSLQKDFLRSQQKNFILTYISDITKKIPNDQTVSLSKTTFSNKPKFTNRIKTTPALVADLQDENTLMPISDVNRNDLSANEEVFVSNNVIRKAAKNLLLVESKDPASISGYKTNSIIPATKSFAGTTMPNGNKKQNENAFNKILVGSLLNKRKLSNQSQLSKSNYINIITRESSEFIEIEEKIDIPIGDLEEDEFYFVLQLKDKFGIVQQTINKHIPHSRLVSHVDIPKHAPKVTTLSTSVIGKTTMNIRQMDENATGVKIYRREINKGQPNNDATYNFVGEALIRKSEDPIIVEDVFASTNPIIYRIVPYNSSDTLGAEFDSIVVQQKRNLTTKRSVYYKRSHFVSISYEIQEGGIVIKLKNFPPEPIALRLYKKDKTIYEQKQNQVGNTVLIESDTNLPLIFEDKNVKPDRIYEYNAEFIYKDGSCEMASNNLLIEYSPISSNILQLNVSDPEVVQAGDELDIQFSIEKDVIQTEGDLIKTFLSEQGLTSEFQNEIINNREKLQDLFAVRVIRTNITTSEIEDFGVIQSDLFSDKKLGRVKSVKPLQGGYEYQYTMIAYARDAETLFPTLEREINVRTNVSYNLKPYNFKHPITLSRGNIVSDNSLKKNYSKSTFTFGKVVDQKTTIVSLADIQPSLYDGKAGRLTEDSVLVQWKVQGNANKIDHFIIILDILGMKTIVGKSHNVTQNNSFHFVDVLSNKENGALQYFIVPVMYDFSRGPELKTNQVII